MADDVKVKITEKNGVELEFDEELALEAQNVVFDPSIVGELVADDVQEAIDELASNVATSASPGYSFGRSGNVSANTWLNNEGVPSNRAGRYVYINDAIVTKVFISTEDIGTFDVNVYYHEGDQVNLTLLGTVSVVAARGGEFSVNWSVPSQTQLAVRIVNGSAKNVVAGLELQGTN